MPFSSFLGSIMRPSLDPIDLACHADIGTRFEYGEVYISSTYALVLQLLVWLVLSIIGTAIVNTGFVVYRAVKEGVPRRIDSRLGVPYPAYARACAEIAGDTATILPLVITLLLVHYIPSSSLR